ncbi:MAG: extracellular solute-binding protein [Anaerolineae bacterium]|jgi:multiple sugar transport system substrate-binding protein|nr:extracellular solute-binding protein [Anaerolineae bacterium]MBT3711739.1 extracellular solute-binding protein [Anaerolineae bacterium]MBT4459803.1 extracellular solute-binding protein [Anaerolineae bacterium]MBT6059710.1 extracellular solute-binding protein [Anaerolineae bacterium]MBT6323268.1 extracellular solute-binding protein [Anaerolineae bacterium]
MKKLWLVLAALVIASLVLTACGGAAAPEAPMEEAPAEEAPMEEAPAEEAPAGKTQVRWFVGLGAGTDEGAIPLEEAFVEAYNASQDEIELVLEIVDADNAADTLATQIAAGNAPDIVGPVGIKGRDQFKGAWLDLAPLIEANSYDLSGFDPAMVDFYLVQEEGQLGIPFGIFPSFVLYNIDLFDEAGLPYPPAEYGVPYVDADGVEHEWTIEYMTELAKVLTVDANGNDASMEDFDPENIVQFGWMNQWTDWRGVGSMFGAGSLVADDGSAQMPEQWVEAAKWTYDGFWNSWFIPNGPYGGAEFLQGGGGPFSSGNMGMIQMHTWFLAPWAFDGTTFDWDVAAMPSYNGVTTAKMHADTFGILKASDNSEAAFEVLTYMLSEEHATDLLTIYGGMPARLSLQADYYDIHAETNLGGKEINWDVIAAGMAYADNPNHESWMPSYLETNDRYNETWNYFANTPDLTEEDIDAEIATLVADLQAIFDAAE